MRVEISFIKPQADSYGATDYTSHVYPHTQISEIINCIHRSIDNIKEYKPGMEIEILIKEDWTYDDTETKNSS